MLTPTSLITNDSTCNIKSNDLNIILTYDVTKAFHSNVLMLMLTNSNVLMIILTYGGTDAPTPPR